MRTPTRASRLASALALLAYVAIVMAMSISIVGRAGETSLSDLNREAAILAGLFLGVPTLVLAALLAIARIAWLVVPVGVAWLALNALLWLPLSVVVAAVTAVLAIVVAGSLVVGRERR